MERLIKIIYDSYKLILTYFNKFHGEAYKKKFIRKHKNRSSFSQNSHYVKLCKKKRKKLCKKRKKNSEKYKIDSKKLCKNR